MTLIVGIRCRDGAVLAADGAATLGAVGGTTIRQEVKKLKILKGGIVVGTSGPVGLGQRFAGELEECYANNELASKEPFQGMTLISERFRKHISIEQQAARGAVALLGGNANSAWLSASVVCLTVKKQLCLIEYDHNGTPEIKTKNIPFVTIGSGQFTADPFLAFLRKILWDDQLPTLGTGILSAAWTVQHAIETSPGGVAEPMQVVIVHEQTSTSQARELTDSELGEHRQIIEMLEQTIPKSMHNLQLPTTLPPTPPATSSPK